VTLNKIAHQITFSKLANFKRNLKIIPNFYLTYKIAKSPISQSVSWTHYLQLMRISKEEERKFYEIETETNNWSVRELTRQINTSLYERLTLSKDKKGVLKLTEKGQIIEKASDLIKDPYILEFLNLPESNSYSETELEEEIQKIISNPTSKWEEEHEEKDIRRIRRFNQKNIKQLVTKSNRMEISSDHFLNRSYGLTSIPTKIDSTRKTESIDTAENRFVKHALEEFLFFCENCELKFEK